MEAINGRLEYLQGIALGFRNLDHYVVRSLIHSGQLRDRINALQIGKSRNTLCAASAADSMFASVSALVSADDREHQDAFGSSLCRHVGTIRQLFAAVEVPHQYPALRWRSPVQSRRLEVRIILQCSRIR